MKKYGLYDRLIKLLTYTLYLVYTVLHVHTIAIVGYSNTCCVLCWKLHILTNDHQNCHPENSHTVQTYYINKHNKLNSMFCTFTMHYVLYRLVYAFYKLILSSCISPLFTNLQMAAPSLMLNLRWIFRVRLRDNGVLKTLRFLRPLRFLTCRWSMKNEGWWHQTYFYCRISPLERLL